MLLVKAPDPTAVLNGVAESAVMFGLSGPAGPVGPAGPWAPVPPDAAILRAPPRPGVIVILAPAVSVTSSFRELMLLTTWPDATLSSVIALSAILSVVTASAASFSAVTADLDNLAVVTDP